MTLSSYFKSKGLDETFEQLIDQAIDLAIQEDLGVKERIDITSEACIPATCRAQAVVIVKEPAIVSGLEIFNLVMARFHSLLSRGEERLRTPGAAADLKNRREPASQPVEISGGAEETRRRNGLSIERLIEEGGSITEPPGEIIKLEGSARTILCGERLGLNLLQRMSGVATMTQRFVSKAKPYGISILDTRKTTPCLRAFEKYAVASAGGVNHRMGLFDNILIKENHIRAAGSITQAIKAVRKKYPDMLVEVETTTLQEVQEALDNNAEKILLDNMTPELVRNSVALVDRKSKIEVSGGINQSNIDRYLIQGVDYISIGALTHSVKAIDISLEILQII